MHSALPAAWMTGVNGLICATLASAAALPFSMPPAPRVALALGAAGGGMFVDLLYHAISKKRLNEQSAALQQVFDATSDFAFLLDADLRILHASPGSSVYGMAPEALRDQSLLETFAPDTGAVIAGVVRAAGASPTGVSQPVAHLIHLPRGDGRLFEIVGCQPRLSPVPCVSVIMRDITVRQVLQAGMAQFDRHGAVAQLAAGVAHNFNNILAGIMLNAGLIPDAESEEVPVLCERIVQSAERGAVLSRNLFTFARGHEPELGPVPIRPLVADITLLFEPEANRRAIRLEWEAEPDLTALGDRGQLEQILISLLFNARDAVSNSGVIRISATRHGDRVQIAVANNGQPIPPEHLPLIFLPFFSTRNDGTHSHNTGLGLPVCQSLVKGMGGTITVESPPGGETVFSLLLPLAMPNELEAKSEETHNAHSGR